MNANAIAAASSAPTSEMTAPSVAPNINPERAKSGWVSTKADAAAAIADAITAGANGPVARAAF